MKISRRYFCHILVLGFLLMPLFFAHGQSSSCGDKICNPLSGNDNLLTFFNTILDKIIIPIGAILAVVFLVYSGYLFVTAGGNEDQIKTAKYNVLYVVIGAAIILGAKAIAAGIQGTLDSLK